MRRTVYKITVFLLLITLLVPTFSGCARETDEELIQIAEDLLERTIPLNQICFGEGITPKAKGYSSGAYTEASEESLALYGVSSVEDIRDKLKEVYSVAACDYIDSVVFHPVRDDTIILSYRRYYDGMVANTPVLMVNTSFDPFVEGEVTYSNIRVESHSRNRAEILVDITAVSGENRVLQKDVLLAMRYEDGWKFDTLTYASADAN